MKDWMKHFLEQALFAIPDPAYRRRLEQELTDNLTELYRDLERAGYGPEEAGTAALERMGDPKALNRRFREEFLRREAKRSVPNGIIYNCVISGILYVITVIVLCRSRLISFYGHTNGAAMTYAHAIVGVILFVLPFGLTAALMRSCFLWHPHRKTAVTLCLLVPWLAEKAMLWSARQHWPWITPSYVVLTFLGCLVLGQLAGLGEARLPKLLE